MEGEEAAHIVEVDEGADGGAVAVDAAREAAPGPEDEARDDLLRELPGPVDVAAARDEHRGAAGEDAAVGDAELLRRRLARAVGVGRAERVGLAAPARRGLAVHLSRRAAGSAGGAVRGQGMRGGWGMEPPQPPTP
jgi:hypothetical protein